MSDRFPLVMGLTLAAYFFGTWVGWKARGNAVGWIAAEARRRA